MIDPRYPALSMTIVNSLLWRAGAALTEAFARAWPSSRAAAQATAVRRLGGVSSVAFIAAAAVAAATAIQLAVPAYVRSGLPIMWPLTAIVVLIIVAVWSKSFQHAWPHSRLARLLAPPRHFQ